MSAPPDAPKAHPPAPITALHPYAWTAAVSEVPAVNPLDAQGIPTPDAEVLALSADVAFGESAPDALSMRFTGVPARHAQALAQRVLWSLWPGVDGFVRPADAPAHPRNDADRLALDSGAALDMDELDRLLARIDDLTNELITERAEHARTLDATIAEVRQQGADAVELERAELAHVRGQLDAARTAALNAEGAADKARVTVREAEKARKEAEARATAREATIARLQDEAEVAQAAYRDNLAGLQETQGRALDAARARAAEAEREAREARAAHVQLAAEYEALKADAEALRVELAQWKARALDAERGATAPSGVNADAEAAIVARVAAEVAAEWSARLDAERNRREAAEAATRTLRGLLDATTPPSPPPAPFAPAAVFPGGLPAAAVPLAPRGMPLPAVQHAPPVSPPAPRPAPFAPPVQPVVQSVPEAVAPVAVPAPAPASTSSAPVPTPPPGVQPAAPEALPAPVPPVLPVIAPGLEPLPATGADAALYALGMTPDTVLTRVGEDARTRKHFHEVVRVVVEAVRPQRPSYDFDALLADLGRVQALTAPDGRALVPALSRVAPAALRERLASVVAHHTDIGIALPRE